jgi:hypothetical protein
MEIDIMLQSTFGDETRDNSVKLARVPETSQAPIHRLQLANVELYVA